MVAMTHAERVAHTVAAFDAAMERLLARLEAVPEAQANQKPEGGGWSAAGIAWHVAAANDGFAGLVDGSRPLASPPTEDFVETPFADIAALVPERLEAPDAFVPPPDAAMPEALARLRASAARFAAAYRALPEDRARWTVKSILGRLTVYQVGDWAVAHVARHNAQAKRVLGR